MIKCALLACVLSLSWFTLKAQPISDSLPFGFEYVENVIPHLRLDIRYITHDNFLGVPVDGYRDTVAILSRDALTALLQVAVELQEMGYGLVVFDGYRPQRAVDHFVKWAIDIGDTLTKRKYYPAIDKKDLFKLDYIASKSGHSRGSTVDLTLYTLESGKEIDMGSGFDFFGPVSNHGTSLISPEQTANRNILRDAMLRNGFKLYPQEWWHYTLLNEPYPDQYYNFEVR